MLSFALAGFFIWALVATPALAQPRVRVVETLTATTDVHDIATLGERTLLATSGGLVVRVPGAPDRVVGARDGLPGVRLRSVTVVGDRAWLGGIEGTAVVAFGADGSPAAERTVPVRRVRRAVRFANATWLGTYGDGLFRLEDGVATPTPVGLGRGPARDRITDLLVVGDELWVATAGSGILRVGPDARLRGRVASGLADLLVWDLEPVANTRVLVATIAGLSVVAPDGTVVANAPEARAASSMRVRDVRSVARIAGHTFVATYGGGVYRIDPGATRATRIDRNAVPSANTVAATHDGALLVGHDAGLARAAIDARRLEPLPLTGLPAADVTSLARAFGALWVGTFDRGLTRVVNGRAERVTRAHERFAVDLRINDLAVARDRAGERLYIATDRGLFVHDGTHFVPVEDRGGPGRAHVTSLNVDRDGAVWATSSRTLSRFRGGRWQSWSGDDTLPVAHLHAVTTDARGRVWVGSLHGLYRFDARTGAFARESTATGALPVDWVTALEPWRDGIVAGTYHGGLSWNADGSRFDIERESRARGGLPAGWVNPHAMRFVGSTLFIGTLERGLAVGERGRWAHLGTADGLPSADVTDILPAGNHSAWVATRGGLARVAWD